MSIAASEGGPDTSEDDGSVGSDFELLAMCSWAVENVRLEMKLPTSMECSWLDD